MRASIVVPLLAGAASVSAWITTITEPFGVCYSTLVAPTSTKTVAAYTTTITEPATLTVTHTDYVIYTPPASKRDYRYPPKAREQSTFDYIDICSSTSYQTSTPVTTAYNAQSTATTSVSAYTTTIETTYTLCAPW